jgi:hypothetical protein
VPKHLGTVDLEAFAELDIGAVDDLPKLGLALKKGDFQISFLSRTADQPNDAFLTFPRARSAARGTIGGRNRDSPSTTAECELMRRVVTILVRPDVAAAAENLSPASLVGWTCTR